MTLHGMLFDCWNTTKSLSKIWQHILCLLDEGIAEICKKLCSHDGFLRADQDRSKQLLPDGLDWLSKILQVAEKAIMIFHFLADFCNPLSSRHEKHCQMLERLQMVFHQSRNISCLGSVGWRQEEATKYHLLLLQVFCLANNRMSMVATGRAGGRDARSCCC